MKERIITIGLFFVVVASSFFFGYHRLSNYSGVDEHYWSYDRVPTFWKAIKDGKWKKTSISDKPGVTLAMVSGAGLPFIGENPHNYKKLRYAPKTPEELRNIRNMYFWLRLPVFIFTLAVLPLFYFLIRKLLGRNTARLSILFIGLSPVLLGISLIVNSDAMLWIMTGLSTLSFFAYLNSKEKKYLALSGFFLGLSIITKYVANILLVYFFLIFFLEYIFSAKGKVPIRKYLKEALIGYIIITATAIATAFVFFPATWVNLPKLAKITIANEVFSSIWPIFVGLIVLFAVDTFVFKSKFSGIAFGFLAKFRRLIAAIPSGFFLLFSFFVFLVVYAHLKIYDLQAIVASPKGIGEGETIYRYIGAISADFYSLIFSVSPLVLVLIIFTAGALLARRREWSREAITAVYIIVFTFIFYLGSAVNEVITMVRYQIMVYPLIFVMAAIGLVWILETKKIKKYVHPWAAYAAVAMILFASLWRVSPNFLAYASEILPKDYIVNLKGMGEGSFEAANYLNSLPNAQGLVIWTDKGSVCEAFVGECLINFRKETLEAGRKIDYFVFSTDRRSRVYKLGMSRADAVNFKKGYESDDYVFRIIINNNPNDFVKVFKGSDIIIKKENQNDTGKN